MGLYPTKLLAWFDLRSLQTRIAVGVLVLSLIVLWSAVFMLDRTLRRDMETTISAQQLSTVALIANELDIVLMDIQMPVLNGIDATREIHRFAPDLPIIGQTAHALEEERAACLAAGMVDHIPKQINPEALFAMILQHVSQASGARIPS